MPSGIPFTSLQANCVGNFARAQLAQPGRGRVMGSASHGVFCLTASSRILFLSAEKKFGPLTINLDSLPEIPPSRWLAAEVEHSPAALTFPNLGLQVDLTHAHTWQPPPQPSVKTTAQDRKNRNKLIACELLRSGRETILLPILKWLVNPSLRIVTPFVSRFDWMEKHEDLSQAIELNEPRRVALALHPFTGMGTGLTPSGDDFTWGFLLALNRWQPVLCPHFDLDKLGALLLASARRQTTFLSASLLECASFGWADAGILSVLDDLFAGQMNIDQAADILLAYGSTSGLDAFAGMATALQCCSHLDNDQSS